jgi:hypothetical protein
MATFWRPFHHVGKIMKVKGGGEGAHPPPFTLSTITSKAVVYTLQLRGQIHPYISSILICTLWSNLSAHFFYKKIQKSFFLIQEIWGVPLFAVN